MSDLRNIIEGIEDYEVSEPGDDTTGEIPLFIAFCPSCQRDCLHYESPTDDSNVICLLHGHEHVLTPF